MKGLQIIMANLDDLKKRTTILFKRLKGDINTKKINQDICNNYVNSLSEIKEELYDCEQYWIKNFDDIYEPSGGLFSDPSKQDIKKVMEESLDQFENILIKLGIDPDEIFEIKKEQQSGININVSPSFSQSQSQYQSINIDNLLKEFEEELKKPKPDKPKLRSIMEKVLEYGKEYAPKLIKLLLDYWWF